MKSKHIEYSVDVYGFWHKLRVCRWQIAGTRYGDGTGYEVHLTHLIFNGLNVETKIEFENWSDRWGRLKWRRWDHRAEWRYLRRHS